MPCSLNIIYLLPLARRGNLDANCVGTELFLHYCATVASKARVKEREQYGLNYLANVAHWVPRVARLSNGFTVDCGEGLQLQVSASGVITNFVEVVKGKHENVFQAWIVQWSTMRNMGILNDEMQESLSFIDLISFLSLAPKTRRQQNKRPWADRLAGTFLDFMLKRIVQTLSEVAHIYFWRIYSDAVPVNDAAHLPSRQLRPMASKDCSAAAAC